MSQCDPTGAIHVGTPNVLLAALLKTHLLKLYVLKQIHQDGQLQTPDMCWDKYGVCMYF